MVGFGNNRLSRDRLVEDLRLPRGAIAADVGAGDGQTGARMLRDLGFTVYACEKDAAKAELAAEFAEVAACDVRAWAPPEPLDLVYCSELLEHLPPSDQPELLRSIRSWLRPGGFVVLSTPQRHSPVAVVERAYTRLRRKGPYNWWDPTHVGVLSRTRLEALFAETGFVVIRRLGKHLVPDLVPLPALHRTVHEGPLSVLGFDLVYLLRPQPRGGGAVEGRQSASVQSGCAQR